MAESSVAVLRTKFDGYRCRSRDLARLISSATVFVCLRRRDYRVVRAGKAQCRGYRRRWSRRMQVVGPCCDPRTSPLTRLAPSRGARAAVSGGLVLRPDGVLWPGRRLAGRADP